MTILYALIVEEPMSEADKYEDYKIEIKKCIYSSFHPIVITNESPKWKPLSTSLIYSN